MSLCQSHFHNAAIRVLPSPLKPLYDWTCSIKGWGYLDGAVPTQKALLTRFRLLKASSPPYGRSPDREETGETPEETQARIQRLRDSGLLGSG